MGRYIPLSSPLNTALQVRAPISSLWRKTLPVNSAGANMVQQPRFWSMRVKSSNVVRWPPMPRLWGLPLAIPRCHCRDPYVYGSSHRSSQHYFLGVVHKLRLQNLAFLTTYLPPFTFSMVWKFTKSQLFWPPTPPPLVNVVCERPLSL